MICSKCGQQVPDNVAFCRNCGTPTGVSAANAANAAMQAAQAAQAAAPQPGTAQQGMPVQPAVVRTGEEVGVPAAGISGAVLGMMGPDRVKSAKLLWRILAGVGMFFAIFHIFGLWFGKVFAIDADFDDYFATAFHSWCDSDVFEHSGLTLFIMVVEIIVSIAAAVCLVKAVMEFLAVDASETFKHLCISFGLIAGGKLFLVFWNLGIRSDLGEGADEVVNIPFLLFFSLVACIAFAALFWTLNSEFYRYREPAPAQAPQQPYPQAPQQPYAQAPQQPYAQAPQQPYPQAPQQPQNPQNPYQQ